MSEIKTPKYWETMDRLKEKITVKTAYGHEVQIPKVCANGWESAQRLKIAREESGLVPTDGLEDNKDHNFPFYDLERVFYEIYEED